ncbi:MAG: hypothetical protein CVV14_12970 [Gammaproteobacteria bacterium HGW-Gammaproteobacteria-4]|jgi:hypothetical protein|nr:MAG: hypothetical protein CVV14_12970 [Gammaproteobacteria bacterium HGW-Gammaproteobacteria-4]
MRKLIIASVLVVSSVIGLGFASTAKAGDTRIFVDLGSVYFAGGQPYYRDTYEPLYVVHYAHGPRYYYSRPAYGYSRHYDRGYYTGYRYRTHDGYRGGHVRHDSHGGRHDRGHDRGHDRRRGGDHDDGHRGDRGRGHR